MWRWSSLLNCVHHRGRLLDTQLCFEIYSTSFGGKRSPLSKPCTRFQPKVWKSFEGTSSSTRRFRLCADEQVTRFSSSRPNAGVSNLSRFQRRATVVASTDTVGARSSVVCLSTPNISKRLGSVSSQLTFARRFEVRVSHRGASRFMFTTVKGSSQGPKTRARWTHAPSIPPDPQKQRVGTTRARFRMLCWCRRVLYRDSPAYCGGSVPVANDLACECEMHVRRVRLHQLDTTAGLTSCYWGPRAASAGVHVGVLVHMHVGVCTCMHM
jgi:hypothetical protein